MRPDAILINTCRGPVVDEAAVAEALDAGRLLGYGADVFDVEPPPADHPLIGRQDNVLLTPHSAAQTVESLLNMARGVAEDVVGVLHGEPPRNPVNDPAEVAAEPSAARQAAVDRPWEAGGLKPGMPAQRPRLTRLTGWPPSLASSLPGPPSRPAWSTSPTRTSRRPGCRRRSRLERWACRFSSV